MTTGPKPSPSTSAPWTEAHRREAWCRVFELTAVALREHPLPRRSTRPFDPEPMVGTEAAFRVKGLGALGFDAARVSREVRRVRALAEGRLVRETSERFFVRRPNGEPSGVRVDTWDEAATWARDRNEAMGEQARARGSYQPVRVRVTRSRRVP